MKQTNKTIGLLAMGIVVFIYGVSYIAREAIGTHMSTFAILAIQMGIMAIVFTLYNLISKKSFRMQKKDIPWIIASGLFGTTFFHGATILSVNSLGATVSSLLYGFAAAFALIIEILLFKRKKTILGIISILMSFAGIYILMDMNLQDLASTNFKGYLLGLASVVSWVIYTFLGDKISADYEKTVVLNYQALVGVITTLPVVLLHPLSLDVLTKPVVIGNLLILGLFNSTIAYFLNMYAIKQIGVTLSNLFLNFLPVVTMLLSIVLYHTLPTSKQILGGLLILLSVFMLDRDQKNIESTS